MFRGIVLSIHWRIPNDSGRTGGPHGESQHCGCSAQVGASCLVDRGRSAEAHGLWQCGRWRLP